MDFRRIQDIEGALAPKRALIIYGPRRVGKTTLLRQYLQTQTDKNVKLDIGDDISLQQLFNSGVRKDILEYARPYDIIAIDEAQNIKQIGLAAKMIIDEFPEKILILTGSSSFDLSQSVGEPLTGRKFTLNLLPLSQREMSGSEYEIKQHLEDFLIFGSYPEVLLAASREDKQKILDELVDSYLFKDILVLDKLNSPELLLDIARSIAFQVGSEVSLNELGTTVGADKKTVARYIGLLEKSFIVKKVKAWSRNQRNEISKKSRYYFLDNGVRNAIIQRYSPLNVRDDKGALFENFVFTELYKKNVIHTERKHIHFWRTHTGQEIDFVIEQEGHVSALECKWNPDAQIKVPSAWITSYPDASFSVIHTKNYLEYL